MSVAYVLDDLFAEHRPPGEHPERPERIVAVRDALRAAGLPSRGTHLPTRAAAAEELGLVHTAGYVADLTRAMPGKAGWLDADTYFSPRTWDAVVAAAAGVSDVTLGVLSGEFTRGLALVRPPGHHAEADRAMGFCMINNVAVAAAKARAAGASRVAIVDWDVHHGNGTQHMFYDDGAVMYASCHQYPYYPGTGAPSETGAGDGAGTTVNVGFGAGCGDADYIAAFDEVFVPELARFAPDVVIISAGFDAYIDDPLAGMRVTREGYQQIAARVVEVADRVSSGRIVCALEGGYDLRGLAGGVVAVLDAMDGRIEVQDAPAPSARGRAAIDATIAALAARRGGAA